MQSWTHWQSWVLWLSVTNSFICYYIHTNKQSMWFHHAKYTMRSAHVQTDCYISWITRKCKHTYAKLVNFGRNLNVLNETNDTLMIHVGPVLFWIRPFSVAVTWNVTGVNMHNRAHGLSSFVTNIRVRYIQADFEYLYFSTQNPILSGKSAVLLYSHLFHPTRLLRLAHDSG